MTCGHGVVESGVDKQISWFRVSVALLGQLVYLAQEFLFHGSSLSCLVNMPEALGFPMPEAIV